MDKRIVVSMIFVIAITVIAVVIYYATVPGEVLMTEPLNMTSITQDWYCENGRAFEISSSKILAVCKGEYVDIRQVIKHKATIKGIQLTLAEWKQLNVIINDVNDIL